MTKYEYKVIEKRIFIEKMLNKLSQEGWELVTTVYPHMVAGTTIGTDKYIFKRAWMRWSK